MPSVREGESRSDYMKRCVPYVMDKEGLEQDAAVGKCEGMYDSQSKKNIVPFELKHFDPSGYWKKLGIRER